MNSGAPADSGSNHTTKEQPQSTNGHPPSGRALCLSGGGFRATLFDLGSIRRLNELGILASVDVISSVSGGSVLNGVLATRWHELHDRGDGTFDNFDKVIAEPVIKFSSRDLRTPLLVGTRLSPANLPELWRDFFSVRANFLARSYQPLFDGLGLAELPDHVPGQRPRFIFCATTAQTGACWHFHAGQSGRMGDFYTGYLPVGDVTVGEAVAASSAFPPGFGALQLRIKDPTAFDRIDPVGRERPKPQKRDDLPARDKRTMFLADGGVYDNLGVEPIWDHYGQFLISDAGHPFSSSAKCRQALISRLAHAAGIAMEQVVAVRKRWLVRRFDENRAQGAIWTLNTLLADFEAPGCIGYDEASCDLLAGVRTDFNAFSPGEAACLENHGYSLADAAVRSFVPRWCRRGCPMPTLPYNHWAADDVACRALAKSGARPLWRDLLRYLFGCWRQLV